MQRFRPFFVCFFNGFEKSWCWTKTDFLVFKICKKWSCYIRPILISYRHSNANSGRRRRRRRRKQRQRRGEKEEAHPVFFVELQDFRKDWKRRIIDNDATFWVFLFLIVAVWIKRSDKWFPTNLVFFFNPFNNGIIDKFRRVAIVGCFFCLELFKKCLIFFVFRQVFPCFHSSFEILFHPLNLFIIGRRFVWLPRVHTPLTRAVGIPSVGFHCLGVPFYVVGRGIVSQSQRLAARVVGVQVGALYDD